VGGWVVVWVGGCVCEKVRVGGWVGGWVGEKVVGRVGGL
jgi:hypothetical protein